MAAECMILPTREVLQEFRPLLQEASQRGVSWIYLGQYLFDTIVQGERDPVSMQDFMFCLFEMSCDHPIMNPGMHELIQTEEFGRMFYALYLTVLKFQEILLASRGKGKIISSMSFHSWHGLDIVALIQVDTLYHEPGRVTVNGKVLPYNGMAL